MNSFQMILRLALEKKAIHLWIFPNQLPQYQSLEVEPLSEVQWQTLPLSQPLTRKDIEGLLTEALTKDELSTLARDKHYEKTLSLSPSMRLQCRFFFSSLGIELYCDFFSKTPMEVLTKEIVSGSEMMLRDNLSLLEGMPAGISFWVGKKQTGKSTLVAAWLESLKEKTKGVILSIEDPIKYLHDNGQIRFVQLEKNTHYHVSGNPFDLVRFLPLQWLVIDLNEWSRDLIHAMMLAVQQGVRVICISPMETLESTLCYWLQVAFGDPVLLRYFDKTYLTKEWQMAILHQKKPFVPSKDSFSVSIEISQMTEAFKKNILDSIFLKHEGSKKESVVTSSFDSPSVALLTDALPSMDPTHFLHHSLFLIFFKRRHKL